MKQQHEILFTPMKIGSTTIKNRYILCAMEGANIIESLQGFEFNEGCKDYLLDRAKNGVGLIIPGCVFAKNMGTGEWLYNSEEIFMGPVKELMDELHQYGSKLFLQVGAGSGRSMAPVEPVRSLYKNEEQKKMAKMAGFDVDRLFAGPSAGIPNVWDPSIMTSELSKEDIKEIIDAYGKIALLCKQSGIDGIEVHAIHEGYLLDQFTLAFANKREDEYGGTLDNRLRLIIEIIRSIKNACGEDYPVSVRYSVESKMRGFSQGAVPGETYEEFGRNREESIKVAQQLEAAGADILNTDNGTYDSWFWAHPPVYMPLACNLEDAAFIKNYVKIPVACAGRMEDPDTAAEAVSSGKIDFVGVARQFLCDGEYLTKIEKEEIEDIRPCIACHNGCFGMYTHKGVAAGVPETPLGRCALNPVTFQEKKYAITKASQKKKVVVIGGGIGGMEVARLSALQGHDVTLYEKGAELGGVFISAAAPSFKEKDRMLLDWYRHQIEKLPITVYLNTEVKAEEIKNLKADEIIIATGATPRKVNLPGIENENVMEAMEYLLNQKPVKDTVAIIGGGLTGCEIAYDLALKGKKPIIVEMQDDILKVKDLSAANSNMLRELIRFHEIPVYMDSKLLEIQKDSIIIEQNGEKLVIPVDNVIMSVGYVPGTHLAEKEEHIQIIGDADKVGNLRHVIWKAYDVALSL